MVPETSKKKKLQVMVITVPVDGLAPLGARPSAGIVMTKSTFCICTETTIKGLINKPGLHNDDYSPLSILIYTVVLTIHSSIVAIWLNIICVCDIEI